MAERSASVTVQNLSPVAESQAERIQKRSRSARLGTNTTPSMERSPFLMEGEPERPGQKVDEQRSASPAGAGTPPPQRADAVISACTPLPAVRPRLEIYPTWRFAMSSRTAGTSSIGTSIVVCVVES